MTEQIHDVDVTTLHTWPGNPRRGDVNAIMESVQINGWYGSILVHRPTMQVIVGNHRLMAMRELGYATIPVTFTDIDEHAARRIVLGDNKYGEDGTYDMELLRAMAAEFEDEPHGTGYSPAELDRLLNGVKPSDEEEELIEKPKKMTVTVTCVTVDEQHDLVDLLLAKGYDVAAKF